MRKFLVSMLIIAAITVTWLQSAVPCESCDGEGISMLKQLYPWCAVLFAILLLAAVRKKSSLLVLLAGLALWYPLSVGWHAICGHESYALILLPMSLPALLPLGIGYAYARKEADFILLILYFLALIPAVLYSA